MKILKPVLVVVMVGLFAGVVVVYSGMFSVAADEPHSTVFSWLAETIRERSIAVRASGIEVPPLQGPDLIKPGGAHYNEMCTGCHLRPGMKESEIRSALYPRPPDLTKANRDDPARTFWIIKHGIKMTGMPAWGASHDDQMIWAMVAFLQQLPHLTPEQYQTITRGEGDEGGHGDSEHKHGTDTEEPGRNSASDQDEHSHGSSQSNGHTGHEKK